MRKLFFLFCFSSAAFAGYPIPNLPSKSVQVFGVPLYVSSKEKANVERITQSINAEMNRLSSALDPDCFYKRKGNKICGGKYDKAILRTMEELVGSVKKETNNWFDPYVKVPEGTFRDFGGIAQGFVLQGLKEKFGSAWYGNFAGDLYIGKDGHPPTPVFIRDPISPNVPFAIVYMKAGWVIGSSTLTNNQIRKPASIKGVGSNDLLMVTLFAQEGFNGARLDGWSTAVAAGGSTVLATLWANEQFKDQWGYVYFDSDYQPVCSKNIKCSFGNGRDRLVKVPW